MKTVGEILKHRRERLGMTLAELESWTQIKRQTLQHIENNNYELLAKKDYAEGFIRKYAKTVNIDDNQLVSAHREEIPNSQSQLDDLITQFQSIEPPTQHVSYKEPIQLSIIIVSLSIISVILWIIAVLIF